MAVDLYASQTELKARLHISDAQDDAIADAALAAASRAVDRHCHRRFWQDSVAQTREYVVKDSDMAWVDDIATTAGLIIKTDTTGDYSWAETWDTDDYDLEPANADAFEAGDRTTDAHAWWRIVAVDAKTFPVHPRRKTLQVTAKFGWSAVPDAVSEATLLKAKHLFERKDMIAGVLGFDQAAIRISRWEDPDVVMLLAPFVKVDVGAV